MRHAVAGGMLAWAGGLSGATMLAAGAPAGPVGYLLSATVYAVGAMVCHQLPERSFHYHGAQWPVCARCLGIYAGAALAAVVVMAAPRAMAWRPLSRSRALVAVGLSLNLLTLLLEWTTGIPPSNTARAVAGSVLGAAVGWTLLRVSGRGSSVGVH